MTLNESIKMSKDNNFILLHTAFLIYSFSGIFSKLASKQLQWSMEFLLFYGLSLFILVVYALLWQIALQKIKLSTAFAHKGVTVAWGMMWGYLLFNESITIAKIVSVSLILVGIALMGKVNE